jgi:hypothetical protein
MTNLYRGPSIDASYQVSVHLAEGFQRKRLKYEKLTANRRHMMDAKWWQKLLLPLARWAKKTNLNLPNYLNEQKQISTFQTTSKNKNKSQPFKLPQWTKKNLHLPNYLKEQQKISTFQTTSMNKNISQPSKLPQWTNTYLNLPNYLIE